MKHETVHLSGRVAQLSSRHSRLCQLFNSTHIRCTLRFHIVRSKYIYIVHVPSRYPYAAVAEMTYGEGVSRLVTFVLDLTVFGAGIPNLLLGKR